MLSFRNKLKKHGKLPEEEAFIFLWKPDVFVSHSKNYGITAIGTNKYR
jgi:hypothetical protein